MSARWLIVAALIAMTAAGCTLEAPARPQVVAVDPVISYAGLNEIDLTELTAAGYVEGVSEAGGECRFTFWAENGGASRLTAEGEPDGDRTSCGPVSIDAAQLPSGSYSVVLIYESATAAGVSERLPLDLP